jgi:hypothetical protein
MTVMALNQIRYIFGLICVFYAENRGSIPPLANAGSAWLAAADSAPARF